MNALRLSLLTTAALSLIACGGSRLAPNKEAAAQAAFNSSQYARPPGAMMLMPASGVDLTMTGQYTADCRHGGKATVKIDLSQLASGSSTSATGEFDMQLVFDNCSNDGHTSQSGTLNTHYVIDAADPMSPELALHLQGRVNLSGEVSDFVDADVTQYISVSLADATTGSVTLHLDGTITTSSGTYTYNQSDSISFDAGGYTVDHSADAAGNG